MKLTPMGVIAPILARMFNTYSSTELLGKAKSMHLIKCLKFREVTMFIHHGLSKNKGLWAFPVFGKEIWNDLLGKHTGY